MENPNTFEEEEPACVYGLSDEPQSTFEGYDDDFPEEIPEEPVEGLGGVLDANV